MAKLSASGYLYRPESKLRTLMCVFSLDPDSIDAKMTELISIIHKGNFSSWLAEPFCSAFVEQLQLYIDSCHTILDNISDIDGDEAESRLDKMLAAIAIQQILAAGRIAPLPPTAPMSLPSTDPASTATLLSKAIAPNRRWWKKPFR